MDRWLTNAPALAHIKPGLWAVFNTCSEPILWTEDAKEVAWFFHQIQPPKAEPVAVPQSCDAKKRRYKRGAYGLPPKWRREEVLARK